MSTPTNNRILARKTDLRQVCHDFDVEIRCVIDMSRHLNDSLARLLECEKYDRSSSSKQSTYSPLTVAIFMTLHPHLETEIDADSGKGTMTSYGSMSSLSSTHSANSTGGNANSSANGGATGTLPPLPDYPETIINIKQMKEVMEQGIMM